jgi:hypothetical protein
VALPLCLTLILALPICIALISSGAPVWVPVVVWYVVAPATTVGGVALGGLNILIVMLPFLVLPALVGCVLLGRSRNRRKAHAKTLAESTVSASAAPAQSLSEPSRTVEPPPPSYAEAIELQPYPRGNIDGYSSA